MKINPLSSGLTDERAVANLDALAHAVGLPFHLQVDAAGLNPASELQQSDLRDIDVSRADLRGYNFTGADLSGAIGVGVIWDKTTIFSGANLHNSIFAAPVRHGTIISKNTDTARLLARLIKSGFNEAVLWSANVLSRKQKDPAIIAVVESLFLASQDDSLKSQLLFFLQPNLSDQAIKELLLASLSSHSLSGPAVRTALGVLKNRGMLEDTVVRAILLALLDAANAPVRESSLALLIRGGVRTAEFQAIWNAIGKHQHLGSHYVQLTAKSMGEAFQVVTRHPVTRDTFKIDQRIDDVTQYLIARRWLKLESNSSERRRELPLSQRTPSVLVFSEAAVRQRMKMVVDIFDVLRKRGIRFNYNAYASEQPINGLPVEVQEEIRRRELEARLRSRGTISVLLGSSTRPQ